MTIEDGQDYLLVISCSIFIMSWIYLILITIMASFHTPFLRTKSNSVESNCSASTNNTGIRTTLMSNYPSVSIIIPARNEQNNIKKCIMSLISQNYPNFEVIVVDDNSIDDTARIIRDIIMNHSKVSASGLGDKSKKLVGLLRLTSKPYDWMGKAWASQQGYLHSRGSILLFTDADTNFIDKNTVALAVSYMLKRNLDVLTGNPTIELRDFWSKITMPLWNHFSILMGANTAAVNKKIQFHHKEISKSKLAYLSGAFFVIHRSVLEEIKGFESVKSAIHEDVELGRKIKNSGYSLGLVKLDNMVTALWSRDVQTLWHGIKRTFAPMKKKLVILNFLVFLFMALFPFLLLIYSISVPNSAYVASSFTDLSPTFLIGALCIIIVGGTALNDINRYKITPLYSLLAPLGAIFIVLCYTSIVTRLLFSFWIYKPHLLWRGREYS